jgi:Holliday junction resolvase RusA-like endonuclease
MFEKFIKCVPPKTTYQASQTILKTQAGRYFLGKSAKGKKIAQELTCLLLEYRPAKPFLEPIELTMEIYYPFNKTELKRVIKQGVVPHGKRPDLDNIAKGLLDALQKANYFKDDALICKLNLAKYFSTIPGIYIKINEK